MKSRRGLEVSTDDPKTLEALDLFWDRLLRISPGAEAILSATEEAPTESALHLATALFWLFGQTQEAQENASRALASVKPAALNSREKRWLDALTRWHARRFEEAARAFESLTQEWPNDLIAAKAAEFLYYILGQQHHGPRFRAHLARLASIHKNDPDFLAMNAFAHELCGETAVARDIAESALKIVPTHPWAQHALEHVLLWEGNDDAAVALMANWASDWNACARPIHSHNGWHLSLAYLDRLDGDRASKVFDEHVWMQTPGMVVEQLDSIAFLWRSEMAGFPLPATRWLELLPHIQTPSETLFMPFATAHYAYALARAGATEAVEDLIARVRERAGDADSEATRVWAPTGLPVVMACASLGAGDAVRAVHEFEKALPRLTEIGGSDAQNDLFRFAYMDSLFRSGRKSDALTALKQRIRLKNPSPLEEALCGDWR
jgi:tetratricopeptide (TPR) repeat protein